VSGLRSVVEELRSESLPELPDALIEEDFAELHRAVELLEAERLRRLAEIDRRRLFERDGHLSAASWLATRFKVAWGTAREQVRMARGLEEMPETRRALDEGELSMSAVRVLVAARDTDPSAFERSESTLVEAARIHSMNDLKRVASYWRQAVEREHAAQGEEKLREQRRLHASVSLLGWCGWTGTLTPRRERRCSPPWGRCWMLRPARGLTTIGPRRSAEQTPWARFAVSGSMGAIAPPWPASGHT
jgi:hypothetical protein